MNQEATDIQNWLGAMITASEELATSMLGMDDFEMLAIKDKLPDRKNAAYIALVGQSTAVQIGLGASVEGCQQLARSLMCMEPEEEDLPEDEVADAISEIANILAGQVKTIISLGDEKINLGLPMFIRGVMSVSDTTQAVSADVRLGNIPATLLVLKSA